MPKANGAVLSSSLLRRHIFSGHHAGTSRDEIRIWRLIQPKPFSELTFLSSFLVFAPVFTLSLAFSAALFLLRRLQAAMKSPQAELTASIFLCWVIFSPLLRPWGQISHFPPRKPPSMSWFGAINCFLVTPSACLYYGLIRGCPLCHSLKMIWTVSLFLLAQLVDVSAVT